jgi:hypothetical protein
VPCCIQIEGDPTKWWIEDQLPANELTAGQPLTVTSLAPIEGILVLSPKNATVAVSNVPAGPPPSPLDLPGEIIYLPTAAGPSAGHVGYVLADGVDPMTLSGQIAGSMHAGQHQSIALGGAGGTLVINGATLTFAVLGPIGVAGGSTPHG